MRCPADPLLPSRLAEIVAGWGNPEVVCLQETRVRPRSGGVTSEFRACVYTTDVEETEYLALVLGDIKPDQSVLVRVQSADMLRDVFGVGAADTDHPATVSLRMIEEAGSGIMLYVYSRARTSLLGRLGGPPSSAAVKSRSRACTAARRRSAC